MWEQESDRNYDIFDFMRRRMDRVLDEMDDARPWLRAATLDRALPRLHVHDRGDAFIVRAELPGIEASKVQLTLLQQSLTLQGERRATTPEGAAVHRQERPTFTFSRTVGLPARVDPERVGATVIDGVLTVTLEKAKEVLPRQISVKS